MPARTRNASALRLPRLRAPHRQAKKKCINFGLLLRQRTPFPSACPDTLYSQVFAVERLRPGRKDTSRRHSALVIEHRAGAKKTAARSRGGLYDRAAGRRRTAWLPWSRPALVARKPTRRSVLVKSSPRRTGSIYITRV